MLRIAIQSKGRLYEDCMSLLSEAGVKFVQSKRSLLVQASGFPLEVLFLRDDDIPQCVADGVADIGIVGLNEVKEKNADVKVVQGLGISACRLSVAIPAGAAYEDKSWLQGKTIATSYPNILKGWLRQENIEANIHVICGSVEIAPNIGLSDAIFDIVSSGSTLVTNHLKEVEEVLRSEAVLIAHPQLEEDQEVILQELLFRLEAVRKAKNKKYVMMNVPDESLQEILDILPSEKSPTVIPLATKGWHSVHTVISESEFWALASTLKARGADGILALDIEKIIL